MIIAVDDKAVMVWSLAAAPGWPLAVMDGLAFPDVETRLRLPHQLPERSVLLRGLQVSTFG